MGKMVRDTQILRRIAIVVLTAALAAGISVGVTGCDNAEDAIQDAQEREAEQFEQDVETGAGGASDAQDAVDALNEQTGAAEDAQNDY